MSVEIYNSSKKIGIANFDQETPRQEVSNRSILRIQQLSNEMKGELNEMELFGGKGLGRVKEVLFAARDHRHEQNKAGNQLIGETRWYNFRLCATYGFCTIQKDGNHSKWGNSHYEKLNKFDNAIRRTFAVAKAFDPHTAANYAQFKRALDTEHEIVAKLSKPDEASEPDKAALNRREALDQLLVALAVLPYRGVLPSLLERYFFGVETGDDWKASIPKNACFFTPTDEPDRFTLRSFDSFQWDKKGHEQTWDDFELSEFGDELKDDVKKLFYEFVLPFTRGKPITDTKPVDTNGVRHENWDMRGFAVPAYDTWLLGDEGGWRGGNAGWLVVILENEPEAIKTFCRSKGLHQQDLLSHSWLHFTDLVRAYVRRVREANMRDLLEDYASPSGSPERPKAFFTEHLHQVIGWRLSKSDKDKDRSKLKVPFDQSDGDINEWVVPIKDTRWAAVRPFPPGTRRLCKLYLDELRLVLSERQKGRGAEKRAQYFAASHELKKLASLIPLAKGHDHILDRLPGIFLMFTLPSAGKINERDTQYLPELLWRKQTQKLREWINDLIRLAAEIEAVVKPGQLGGMLTNRSDFDAIVEKFISKFHLDATFDSCRIQVPTHFPARCLYGVGLLCLLRNILQHAFKYDNAAPSGNLWMETYREQVVVSVGGLPESLTFTNPTSANPRNDNGGTNDAATFYFDQLAEVGWHFEASAFFNGFAENAGVYECRVPLPRKTQRCDD